MGIIEQKRKESERKDGEMTLEERQKNFEEYMEKENLKVYNRELKLRKRLIKERRNLFNSNIKTSKNDQRNQAGNGRGNT